MTGAQCATLDYLEGVARETGATVKCDEYSMTDDGTLLVIEISADRDMTAWNLYRDGRTDIL